MESRNTGINGIKDRGDLGLESCEKSSQTLVKPFTSHWAVWKNDKEEK